jgi:hypothetical protein
MKKVLGGFIFFLSFALRSVCYYNNGHTEQGSKRKIQSASALPSPDRRGDEGADWTLLF